jgi:hypothetical protein
VIEYRAASSTRFAKLDLIPFLESNLPGYVQLIATELNTAIQAPVKYLYGWRDPFAMQQDTVVVMSSRTEMNREDMAKRHRVLLVLVAVGGKPDEAEVRVSAWADALQNLIERDGDLGGTCFGSRFEEATWLASPAGAERMSIVTVRIESTLSSL